jgi:hypothetical protein
MATKIARGLLVVAAAVAALGAAGCGGVQLRTASMPSESKRQFLGLKKVAVLPFNNPAGEKQGEDLIIDLMVTELNIRRTFEQVEDPHYVANVLKALKIRKIEDLDLETVKKMGSEMKSQAVIIGNINAWGLGKGQDAAMQVSVTLTVMDTETGKPIWIGNGTRRASFTMSRAFGLDEGPTDLEVGREVVMVLLRQMDGDINDRREAELVRIKEEEEAKLKAAAEAEKRRLREQLERPAETVPAPVPVPVK